MPARSATATAATAASAATAHSAPPEQIDQNLLDVDGTYELTKGHVYNLRADRFVSGQSDIQNRQVAHAMLARRRSNPRAGPGTRRMTPILTRKSPPQCTMDSLSDVTSYGVDRFVVKLRERAMAEDVAEAERLSDDAVMVLAPGGRATKEAWQQVVDIYGGAVWVLPVLTDEGGHERYPIGDLTVRFGERLSDEEVRDFASKRSLRVDRRNVYQPAQVVLVPERPRELYLPELCEQLQHEPVVARAWLNTESRYTRA